MEEVGIEPTSSIGDALAMRPLHPMPAGIGLPLAELILGRGDFAFCGRRPKGSALWTSASLERLDLTFSSLLTPLGAKLRPDALRVGQTTE